MPVIEQLTAQEEEEDAELLVVSDEMKKLAVEADAAITAEVSAPPMEVEGGEEEEKKGGEGENKRVKVDVEAEAKLLLTSMVKIQESKALMTRLEQDMVNAMSSTLKETDQVLQTLDSLSNSGLDAKLPSLASAQADIQSIRNQLQSTIDASGSSSTALVVVEPKKESKFAAKLNKAADELRSLAKLIEKDPGVEERETQDEMFAAFETNMYLFREMHRKLPRHHHRLPFGMWY